MSREPEIPGGPMFSPSEEAQDSFLMIKATTGRHFMFWFQPWEDQNSRFFGFRHISMHLKYKPSVLLWWFTDYLHAFKSKPLWETGCRGRRICCTTENFWIVYCMGVSDILWQTAFAPKSNFVFATEEQVSMLKPNIVIQHCGNVKCTHFVIGEKWKWKYFKETSLSSTLRMYSKQRF